MRPDDDWSTSEGNTRALFDCIHEAAAECLAEMERESEGPEQVQAEQIQRPIRRRTFVRREHDVAHQRLFADYFAEEPRWGSTVFHRRFRMRRDLFLRIVHTLEARDQYFQYREVGIGRPGLMPLQKYTVAIRQLAYSTTADMFDEYLNVGETTGRECLKKFSRGVVEAFRNTYLREQTTEDCQALMNMHEMVHDFPGMLGSIDCMHWKWKNCLTAWRGQFTSGYKGSHPAMILEAIADHRLWILHAYFGVARSNNDINVLNSSFLFTEQCNGNGRQHHMGYYLADGIYMRWLVFLKTISCPTDRKRALFAQRQEAARKDVKRAFGVLQAWWAIVKGPVRFWYKEVIADVMYACNILHNMIVEHEGGRVTD